MREIAVIGTGYVGLVTGACFADLGNKVWCVDIDEAKIESLKRGKVPFFEPGLEEIVIRNLKAGRLAFTTSYPEALKNAQFVFIAVNTPEGKEGEADLSYVEAAAKEIARCMDHPMIIVNKSTVPIGTGDFVTDIIKENMPDPSIPFWVVSNPEFLREGSAVHDFMNPDRIVLGSTNEEAAKKVVELYAPLQAPIIITDIRTAEMIKYASNAFLATKISFINEIANICEALGADVKVVAYGMGLDHRIGSEFLGAGIGWGGSCFPKDVRALAYMAATHGCHPQLLRSVIEINQDQRRRLVYKLRGLLGGSLRNKVIGILGLAFKPNTDDMREAPSVEIIHMLQHEGAKIKAYDPAAMENAKAILNGVEFKENPYQVAEGADALILVTEWNEFKQLDMERVRDLMRQPILIDGRNIYDPEKMKALGFIYRGIGRGFDGAGVTGGS